ncbi:MAG TPA: YicC/YloC family endoribonuclease [Steroidobacteraceae bacterium]|nr:YicC/YloC family endoribonuclease [Steroidobacteraceae bacterium]
MTGFARRERQYPFGLLAWELKTVNHRFLEIGCRLPEELRPAEADFRQSIAAAVRRGKLECSLHFRPAAAQSCIDVDAALLGALTQRVREIAAAAGEAARLLVLPEAVG